MAIDGLFLRVSYDGLKDKALDKTLSRLALSYDSHCMSQEVGSRRDVEFEFSNEQCREKFIDELLKEHSTITVECLKLGNDRDSELAWDIVGEKHA